MHVKKEQFTRTKKFVKNVARELRKRGWTKSELQNAKTGAVCALGAMYFAAGGKGNLHGSSYGKLSAIFDKKDWEVTRRALGYVFGGYNERFDNLTSNIFGYNDGHGTSREKVVARFNEVASTEVLQQVCDDMLHENDTIYIRVTDTLGHKRCVRSTIGLFKKWAVGNNKTVKQGGKIYMRNLFSHGVPSELPPNKKYWAYVYMR